MALARRAGTPKSALTAGDRGNEEAAAKHLDELSAALGYPGQITPTSSSTASA